MTEKLRVFNKTHGAISFNVLPALDDSIWAMSEHHRRKKIRSSGIPVLVQKQTSQDLVDTTKRSIEEIKKSPDFIQIMKKSVFDVLEDSSIVVEEVLVPAGVTVDEVKVEDILTEDELEKEIVGVPEVTETEISNTQDVVIEPVIDTASNFPMVELEKEPVLTPAYNAAPVVVESEKEEEESQDDTKKISVPPSAPVAPIMPQMPAMPVEEKPKVRRGRPPKSEVKPKNKGGRPKNSPNKPKAPKVKE